MKSINLHADFFVKEWHLMEENFFEACDWLKAIGVYGSSNRFGIYEKTLKNFFEKDNINDVGLKNFIYSFAEAIEIVRIYRAFSIVDAADYLAQLKKITSGVAFKNSIGNDPARDFSFELSVASRFLYAGYEVKVGGVADVIAFVGNNKIYVECKRVQSEGKLINRISGACKQLIHRLNSDLSSKSRGLIACKIADILNPENNFAILPNKELFRTVSEGDLQGYIRKNEEMIRPKLFKKNLGILFESNLHGVVYDEKDEDSVPVFMNCRGAAILYNGKMGKEDVMLLKGLSSKIANQGFV